MIKDKMQKNPEADRDGSMGKFGFAERNFFAIGFRVSFVILNELMFEQPGLPRPQENGVN